MDFLAQLKRQIGFIERSCIAFDAGHLEEALRIAVSLRVLFHDTKSSTSLLTHLGAKSSATVLSTFTLGFKEDQMTGECTATIPMWLDNSGERTPPLGRASRHDFIPVIEWWTEVIICMNHKLSRKDIVLAAANQDGGAHVDAAPDKKTAEMVQGVGTLTTIVGGKITKVELDNHHFPLLRQFGHEILSSPDISKR